VGRQAGVIELDLRSISTLSSLAMIVSWDTKQGEGNTVTRYAKKAKRAPLGVS